MAIKVGRWEVGKVGKVGKVGRWEEESSVGNLPSILVGTVGWLQGN